MAPRSLIAAYFKRQEYVSSWQALFYTISQVAPLEEGYL